MANKGSPAPEKVNDSLIRSRDIVQLYDNLPVITTSEYKSQPLPCREYRNFLLYLAIKSTSTPTTLQVKVQFLDRWTGQWHTYKEGLFTSLFWEDADTANGIYECFSGDVMGRDIRVTLTGVGTSGSAYFTVSAAIELRN